MSKIYLTAACVLSIVMGSCSGLPPSHLEASFLINQPIGNQLILGDLHCANPLLPSLESARTVNLVQALAERHGFQIDLGDIAGFPTIDVEYNQVDYDQDLNRVHSLTGFLAVREPVTKKIWASVFLSEDSSRTLESWSVLYSMFDELFAKLRTESDRHLQKS